MSIDETRTHPDFPANALRLSSASLAKVAAPPAMLALSNNQGRCPMSSKDAPLSQIYHPAATL